MVRPKKLVNAKNFSIRLEERQIKIMENRRGTRNINEYIRDVIEQDGISVSCDEVGEIEEEERNVYEEIRKKEKELEEENKKIREAESIKKLKLSEIEKLKEKLTIFGSKKELVIKGAELRGDIEQKLLEQAFVVFERNKDSLRLPDLMGEWLVNLKMRGFTYKFSEILALWKDWQNKNIEKERTKYIR